MKDRFFKPFPVDRDAIASVEFGLLSGLFLFISLGIIELGILLWTWNALETAAALTARCAAIGAAQCRNPQQFAVSTASAWSFPAIISPANVIVGQASDCNGLPGPYEVVTITSPSWSDRVFLAPFSLPLTISECYPISLNSPS